MRHLRNILTMIAITVAPPALAQQATPQVAPVMNTASPADQKLVGAMDKMGSQMAVPLSGNTDQDYARMMLAHHQSAVDMAKVELQDGKDPFLRRLSTQIIASQSAQIRQLQAWQARHPLAAK